MKVLSRLLLLVLIVSGGYYFIQTIDFSSEETLKKIEDTLMADKTTKEKHKNSPENKTNDMQMKGELVHFIGEDINSLAQELGEPIRKDPSSYGYESWLFTDHLNKYLQVGVKDNQIKMIYATGEDISIQPADMGQTYEEVKENFDFKNEISFTHQGNPYRFQLNKEDMNMRPIVQLNENVFLQFYFDTFENKLSSVRVMDSDVLLAHRPYEIYYRNSLPELPKHSVAEWEKIQIGMEQQVFELSNVLRNQYGIRSLKWDEETATVASKHSKDMYDNDYFSHQSLDGRGLKERLREFDIDYFTAGENIAAQYTDSPAAVEGWLNSDGHREALLNGQYTHIGVGVYRYFYTQNFLQKS